DLNNILVVKRTDFNNSPTIVPLKNVGLTPKQKFFLQRWMDITKSTLLFARGVILVEGIAEGLVIPELAKRVLHKYLNSKKKISDYSLEEYSVSVINMGGIYFESFFQLFMNAEEQGKGIPIRCAGITDCDPKESDTPYVGNECECNNPALKLQMILKDNKYCRLYSNSKTFEYDLALCGNNFLVMVDTFLEILETDGSIREDFEKYKKEFIRKTDSEKAKIAKCLLDRIDNPKLCGKGLFAQHLAYKLANEEIEFTVPNYIEKAILWACNLNERSESNVPTNSGN
ncbi:TOPRIM nucleotidyl transferase/hydrolase domain-containing protein, partial [Geobacillus zalihae]